MLDPAWPCRRCPGPQLEQFLDTASLGLCGQQAASVGRGARQAQRHPVGPQGLRAGRRLGPQGTADRLCQH